MNAIYEKLQSCYEQIKDKLPFVPRVALVLGSGLGKFAERLRIVSSVEYSSIEGFPISTVAGHVGRFVFGYIEETPVVCMQGRVHYYEGYSISEVVLPIRLMRLMGAEILFLTNAAGGINRSFHSGDFMMITDQIGDFVPSPLIGANIEELGTRFPDMSEVYRKELCDLICATAKELSIPLKQGIYIQLTGPNFETPAEVRMCGILGADAVGMSTACEAIAANHCGMKVCGISFISNLACGLSDTPLSHAEVQEAADQAAPMFEKLVYTCISKM